MTNINGVSALGLAVRCNSEACQSVMERHLMQMLGKKDFGGANSAAITNQIKGGS